jgi:hypothetical protein
MDADNELARAKWLLIAIAVFLFSACISWGEMIYLVFGRETQADISKIYAEVRSSGRFRQRQSETMMIDYSFTEPDGTRRTGTDSIFEGMVFPSDKKVMVRYTSGAEGRSRLAGHSNWIGIILFLGSLTAIGIFGFRLWREAKEATRDRKPRRK